MEAWNQKRKMIQRYDLTAQMYNARYADEQTIKYKVALKNLKIPHQARILDVGCGTGLLFNHIRDEKNTVVGIDISILLLKLAKARTKRARNLSLVRADADNLPFKEAQFNNVFAFTILQNMPKPSETLIEIKRVTKPNGKVVVTALKKVFSRQVFRELLHKTGLFLDSFEDTEKLKCYVAMTSKK